MTTYHLFKKDNSIEPFYSFASLANAFLAEYGSYPSGCTLQEGNDLYYQGEIKETVTTDITETVEATETVKSKRRNKYEVFNEKWNALMSDIEWVENNRHQFVMDYLVLMTSRKNNLIRTDDYKVTKNSKGYTIKWKDYNDIGLNNLDAQTAYSWTVRKGLRPLAIEADQLRVQLCS